VPRQRPAPATEAGTAETSRALRQLDPTATWRIVGAILGQGALLTALLLYFGWARTRATFAYFGVDLSLLDLSTTDYVLRSVNSAYHPLLLLGLAVFAGVLVHQQLGRPGGRWQARARRAQLGVRGAGWGLVGVGVLALLWSGWSRWVGSWLPDSSALGFAWLPSTLAAGFALLAYGAGVEVTQRAGKADRGNPQLLFVLVALFVMALFWAVSLFAVHDGRARAVAIERDLRSSPEVLLLARELLAIRGPGVVLADLKLPDRRQPYGRYRKSYSGLRLLTHNKDKYFLLPVGWKHGRDRVYEVPDDGAIRVELIAR
jgi:hypothetical protein